MKSGVDADTPAAHKHKRVSARVLATVGIILMTLAVGACGSGSGGAADGEVAQIRVTVSNATEAYVIPWLVADEQGLFKEHGVDVTKIVAGKGGSTTLRNLISGDLAVGEVALPAVIEGKLEGLPVTAVGGGVRTAYPVDFYALSSSPVETPADAKIWAYTNKGSVTQALTYMVPEAAGVDPDSIKHVAAGGVGEGIALLESGEVDAAVVPPTVVAKEPGKFKLVASSAKYLPSFQQTAITVQDSYLEDNPDVVRGVLAGYQDAVASIEKNPDEAARLYADYAGLEQGEARKVVDAALKVDNWSVGVQAKDLRIGEKAMRASGFDGEVPWCALFDPSYLPDGAPGSLPVDCGS